MSTTTYILTGGSGTDTHLDLGLGVGGLSFVDQTFVIKGSAGDNSFFLRPGGYAFDFTENGGGADTVYLTGERSDYQVGIDAVDNSVYTLKRDVDGVSEDIRLKLSDDMRVVFADGYISTNALRFGGLSDASETSLAPDLPATNTGGVRVAASGGGVNTTNVFGLSGPTFTAFGNGGEDHVFVAAGASVDASLLGKEEDKIYLEGSWASYDKTISGLQITFSRTVVNALTGAEQQEVVKVIGGLGAAEDRIFFADGSASTRDLWEALYKVEAPDTLNTFDVTTNDLIWNKDETSFSSTVALSEENPLTLTTDTGSSSSDGVTSNGEIAVSGVAEGYIWQYRINGGDWQPGSGTSFTLDGQTEGAAGAAYAPGAIEVRQVNPFGVASAAVSNAQAIVVDTATGDAAFSAPGDSAMLVNGPGPVSGLDIGPTTSDRVTFTAPFTAAGLTVQFWFHVDDLSVTADRQLLAATMPIRLEGGSDGQLSFWESGSTHVDLEGVKAAEGWNFISISSANHNSQFSNAVDVTIVNARSPEGATASAEGFASWHSANRVFSLGSWGGGGVKFDGVIRDFTIWTGSRDLATVINDSTSPPASGDANLVNYWALDDPAGVTSPAKAVADGPQLELFGDAATGRVVSGRFPGAAEMPVAAAQPLLIGDGAEPFATITISLSGGGAPVGTTTANSLGEWRFSFPAGSALADGEHTITATATDLAGNVSSETTLEITVNASIPATPVLDAASDSGVVGDNITNFSRPTLSGALPPGAASGDEVTILLNDNAPVTVSQTTTTGALRVDFNQGTWEYTPPADLPEGEHTITVSVDGVSSAPLALTVDQTVGYAVIDELFTEALATKNTAATDSGGAVLNHQFGPNATVSAWVYIADPAGAGTGDSQLIFHTGTELSVALNTRGDLLAFRGSLWRNSSITIEEPGWYHITITESEDSKLFMHVDSEAFDSPRIFDAGNESRAAPSRIGFGRDKDGGDRAFDGAFRDIQIWDRVLSDEEIAAVRDGAVIDLTDPALVGYWPMGGVSGSSNAAPNGPELTIGGAAAIERKEGGIIENASFEGDSLVLRGRLSPDVETLSVTLGDGGAAADAVINVLAGTWTATFDRAAIEGLAEGASLDVTLDAADAAGNSATAVVSEAVVLELDNTDPVATATQIDPVTLAFGAAELTTVLDVNALPGGGTAFADDDAAGSVNATLKYSATLENGERMPDWLQMTEDGVLQIREDFTAPDLAEPLTLTVTATDGAGATATRNITLQMPQAPDLAEASDTGVSGSDNITNDAAPLLQGALPPGLAPGTQVAIWINGVSVASGSENTPDPASAPPGVLVLDYDAATWKFTPGTDLPEGDNEIVIQIDDVPSAPLTVTVDQSIEVPDVHAPFGTFLQTNNSATAHDGGLNVELRPTWDWFTLASEVYIADPGDVGNTVSGQVIFSSGGGGSSARSWSGSVRISPEGGALEIFTTTADGWVDTGIVPTEGWAHLAVSVSAETLILHYGDQAFAVDASAVEGSFVRSRLFYFGRPYYDPDGGGFQGGFRDIKVWDTALSAEQMAAARNGVGDPQVPVAIGHWPMDQASGFENQGAGSQEEVIATVAGGAALEQEPTVIIEDASFDGGNLVFSGTLPLDIDEARLSIAGGPEADLAIDRENGTWTATFTRTQMAAMPDGALSYTLTATDLAGNTAETTFDDAVFLELVNEAPRSNDVQDIPGVVAGVGVTGPTGGTTLLDLTDLSGGGETAFIDPDAPGSLNASLDYSATIDGGGDWPSWLEMTQDGKLQIVEGETVPEDFLGVTIVVTAEDGAGETASRQITINSALALTSAVHGEQNLDVRSALTLESRKQDEAIRFNDEANGEFKIRLVQRPDSPGKTGFSGENADGGQTITLTLVNGAVTASDGGTVEIVDGKAIIRFDNDLDLSTNFGIEADEKLFESVDSGLVSDALIEEQLTFATVTPDIGGRVAQIWDADTSSFTAGDTWYDGTSGAFNDNSAIGLDVNLLSVTGIVAIGHDTDATSGIALNATGRTRLTGFGGDDRIYVDRAVGHADNILNRDEIEIANIGSGVTELVFSTEAGSDSAAGVLISFADHPDSGATDFAHGPDLQPGEQSFESLTGNPEPVISG